MSMVIDSHVHLYPCYRPTAALESLHAGLRRLGGDAARVGLLAERSDRDCFAELRDGAASLPGWDLALHRDEGGVCVSACAGGAMVFLMPGRQIATTERLEVLGLMTDAPLPDRVSAADAIEAVRDAGGLPVLNWAPGKWWFGRGGIVRGLLDRFAPADLLLCDTSLRPGVWPEPLLMRHAAARGFTILAGSDPLPFPGQECFLGTYATLAETDFDPNAPALSVRRALAGSPDSLRRAGRRRSLLRVALDVIKNAANRKPAIGNRQ